MVEEAQAWEAQAWEAQAWAAEQARAWEAATQVLVLEAVDARHHVARHAVSDRAKIALHAEWAAVEQAGAMEPCPMWVAGRASTPRKRRTSMSGLEGTSTLRAPDAISHASSPAAAC